ncbi:hypothetical protein SDJN02_17008 [Cucurbita argyrosperma subsp. argyrosperma]|nr:hypothetical protein SDJN02_17008 [Cucurbita argyrosperma subsp. argyrosperma]
MKETDSVQSWLLRTPSYSSFSLAILFLPIFFQPCASLTSSAVPEVPLSLMFYCAPLLATAISVFELVVIPDI